MSRVIVRDPLVGDLIPHYYEKGRRTLPDMYGNLEGYRGSPTGKGNNKSENGVYFGTIDEVAAHLLRNRDWGVRVAKPGSPPSLRHRNIYVDGKKLN